MKLLTIFLAMAVSGCVTVTQRKLEKDVYLLKYRVKKLEKLVDQLEGDVAVINSTPPEYFSIPMPDMDPVPKVKQPPKVAPKPAPLPKAPASPIRRP